MTEAEGTGRVVEAMRQKEWGGDASEETCLSFPHLTTILMCLSFLPPGPRMRFAW